MNNDECGAQTHHPSYEVERDAKDETEPHLVELQYATSNISIERDERDDVVNTRLSISVISRAVCRNRLTRKGRPKSANSGEASSQKATVRTWL
jgi:hypothetical protein